MEEKNGLPAGFFDQYTESEDGEKEQEAEKEEEAEEEVKEEATVTPPPKESNAKEQAEASTSSSTLPAGFFDDPSILYLEAYCLLPSLTVNGCGCKNERSKNAR